MILDELIDKTTKDLIGVEMSEGFFKGILKQFAEDYEAVEEDWAEKTSHKDLTDIQKIC